MAKLYGKSGKLIRLLKTQFEIDSFGDPTDFDSMIEFDGSTNADVIHKIDTEWNNHAIINGELRYKDNPVTISPPGEEWVLDENEVVARTGWKDLGDWATWEPQQAQDYVDSEILNGWDVATTETWVDDNITGTTIAQLRTQTINAIKVLAGNIITIRNILGNIAKIILYIRDILIKRL